MKVEIVKGVAFEIDPTKNYMFCFDRSAGLSLEDLSNIHRSLPLNNSSIAIMVDGDPNKLVKVIESPKVANTSDLPDNGK